MRVCFAIIELMFHSSSSYRLESCFAREFQASPQAMGPCVLATTHGEDFAALGKGHFILKAMLVLLEFKVVLQPT